MQRPGRGRAALELGDHPEPGRGKRVAEGPPGGPGTGLFGRSGEGALAPLDGLPGFGQDAVENRSGGGAHVPTCWGALATLAARNPSSAAAARPSAIASRAASTPAAIDGAPPAT